MSSDLELFEVNASYLKVKCEPSVEQELSEYFTFELPGARFDPRVRARKWDGKLHLLNKRTKQIYRGLLPRIEQWAEEQNYSIETTRTLIGKDVDGSEFIDQLDLPEHITDRWYQVDSFEYATKDGRNITLLSTAGGKSLIFYLLTRYYKKKTLIVVHTIGLITQIKNHFEGYGFDVQKNVHCIFGGEDHDTNKPVVISTWQSIYKNDPEWFKQFEVVIGDEVHLFAAKSLQTVLTNSTNAYHRFGFTGTIQESKCHRLVLEGLFGSVYQPTTTKELADEGWIVPPKVKILVLDHTSEDRKAMYRADYQDEIDFICQMEKRNRYLMNLAFSLNGNTLMLFRLIDKHGKLLYDMMKNYFDCLVQYVDGGTKGDEREIVRQTVIANKRSINICSAGVFSTGIDIPNLHNIILASPWKSRQKVLQSIGRGLRLDDTKEHCNIYDIVDDLSYKNYQNHTLKHYLERIRYYNEEEFCYKQFRIKI